MNPFLLYVARSALDYFLARCFFSQLFFFSDCALFPVSRLLSKFAHREPYSVVSMCPSSFRPSPNCECQLTFSLCPSYSFRLPMPPDPVFSWVRLAEVSTFDRQDEDELVMVTSECLNGMCFLASK